jgi:hypothetical protein
LTGIEVSSAHPGAAIDIVCLGDDVFGLLGGEEDGHARQIGGDAHAAIGDRFSNQFLLLARLAALVFGEQRVDMVPVLAVDDAGRDAVDVDAMPDQAQ